MRIAQNIPVFLLAVTCSLTGNEMAEKSNASSPAETSPKATDSEVLTAASPEYILRRGDTVQVKVYQEEDLTSISRIGQNGTITMPLLGPVSVVSNSLEQATAIVSNLLAKEFLIEPQVTLNVTDFAKRRFTVIGQVQRPNTYDMPAENSVSLLQAIATAGGYTRIGNARKITVRRTVGTETKVFKLDPEAKALKEKQEPFKILEDDVIIVGEKWL